ncbi:MAG: GntR family transcriptional regulator [Lachnospiraceae bacterium]|jgi:GntR family transcriptional regulator|nr:GntR family transcriptional regulator [Lachnospiraceae bacterium]
MPWNLNSDRPIFIQIIEKIQMDIISGAYRPGDKLPSVRELAQEASVNPNTMQKALSELERTGLVYSQRTSGRFITEDTIMIDQLKSELAKEVVTEFLETMQKLGFQREETISLLEKAIGVEPEGGDGNDTGM